MYVGLRELRWAKGRFALMGGAVVLITVLVGLLSGLTLGLGEQSTSAVTGLGAEKLVFSADNFDASQVPTDLLAGATPLGLSTMRASGVDGSGAVEVIGVPPGSDVAPDAHDVRPGAVVLSEAADGLIGSGEVKISDVVLQTAATRGDASYSHLPVIWVALSDWQQLTGSEGSATVLAADGPVADLPEGYHAHTIDDSLSAIGSYSAENGSLLMIRGFLIVIAAMVVGAFFTVWVVQRSGDIAVLKALGASSASLLLDALGQALVVLIAATTVGVAVTLAVGAFAGDAVPFKLDAATLLLPIAMLAGLGLVGAALAVRRVSTVDPLIALSGK